MRKFMTYKESIPLQYVHTALWDDVVRGWWYDDDRPTIQPVRPSFDADHIEVLAADKLSPEAEEMLTNALGVSADDIRAPNHYLLDTPAKECFDVLEQVGLMENHPVASAFAYLWRCMLKGQYSKDIRKAHYFLEKAIERDEASNTQHE